MKTSDFDYQLPAALIAQFPAERRDGSRLMVLHRSTRTIEHRHFHDISEYLAAGDCLVINETKVVPARLRGERIPGGGRIEVFLLRRSGERIWEVLVKPGKRAPVGTRIQFADGLSTATIIEKMEDGRRHIQFENGTMGEELMERWGEVPLPPYINRKPVDADRDRYQTVYAKQGGAVAAPTAGLHFTEEVLDIIRRKGVNIVPILLHVGLGTFRPVTAEDPREHPMEAEYYEISAQGADLINRVKAAKGRIVAVGTTTAKALESAVNGDGRLSKATGWSDIFIRPMFAFHVVDSLLTNFHLPRSTLLMLVSAFADRDFILASYQEAIERKYRFYSYGDAMLIV